jgi:hypothetical protein
MKKASIKKRPLDNVHTYLEISRRFIFGVKVQPGYEKYQKTAKQAIQTAIRMHTPPKIQKTVHEISFGCPYRTPTIIGMSPLLPTFTKTKGNK